MRTAAGDGEMMGRCVGIDSDVGCVCQASVVCVEGEPYFSVLWLG